MTNVRRIRACSKESLWLAIMGNNTTRTWRPLRPLQVCSTGWSVRVDVIVRS
jgi:hypothetical protein